MNNSLADGRHLILASTSIFRKQLLSRLGLPFITVAPEFDETPQTDETAEQLVIRLARGKARSISQSRTNALVIGSDQVADLNGQLLGKPGDHDSAIQQLSQASGNTVRFYTGLCLIDCDSNREQIICDRFDVVFRKLNAKQIENYLRKEQPYQCAGSFKSEGLGIALFEKLQGDDPNSLIGLPLIRLMTMLEKENISVI